MKHSAIAAVGATIVALGAQTLLQESQVQKPLAPVDSLLVQTPAGRIERVQLGTGVFLDKATVPWKLVVSGSPTPVQPLSSIRLISSTTPLTFTGPVGKTIVQVARNGQVMLAGLDCSIAGNVVTFIAPQTSNPTDIVVALVY